MVYLEKHVCATFCGENSLDELLSECVHAQSLQLCLTATLWTVACQAPLSVGFSRQEYWNGLPCPPPGTLPDPGVEPGSPAPPALQADSSPTELPGKQTSVSCDAK